MRKAKRLIAFGRADRPPNFAPSQAPPVPTLQPSSFPPNSLLPVPFMTPGGIRGSRPAYNLGRYKAGRGWFREFHSRRAHCSGPNCSPTLVLTSFLFGSSEQGTPRILLLSCGLGSSSSSLPRQMRFLGREAPLPLPPPTPPQTLYLCSSPVPSKPPTASEHRRLIPALVRQGKSLSLSRTQGPSLGQWGWERGRMPYSRGCCFLPLCPPYMYPLGTRGQCISVLCPLLSSPPSANDPTFCPLPVPTSSAHPAVAPRRRTCSLRGASNG